MFSFSSSRLQGLATALVCSSVIPCLSKRPPDRSDEEFWGFVHCVVFCPNFLVCLWCAGGCSLPCGVTDLRQQDWEQPGGCPRLCLWEGSGLGTGQVFCLLVKGMVVIHDGSRANGKSSKAAFAHIWLQLAVLGIVLF